MLANKQYISARGNPTVEIQEGTPSLTTLEDGAEPQKSAGNVKTLVTFKNNTDVEQEVFWVDFKGDFVLYRTLAPGQSYAQSTFAGHVWVIRGQADPAYKAQQAVLNFMSLEPQVRKLRLTITAKRDPRAADWKDSRGKFQDSIQLAEIAFFESGDKRIKMKSATNPKGRIAMPSEGPRQLVVPNGKWIDLDFKKNGNRSVLEFTIEGNPKRVRSYALRTGNDAPQRDPVAWTLEGLGRDSQGTDRWIQLEERAGMEKVVPSGRNTFTERLWIAALYR